MAGFTRFIFLQAVSIAEVLTATNILLGTATARGLIIPVSALAGGSTLSFYYRQAQPYNQNSPNTFLDARAALGVFLGGYSEGPPGPGRFYINGNDTGRLPVCRHRGQYRQNKIRTFCNAF